MRLISQHEFMPRGCPKGARTLLSASIENLAAQPPSFEEAFGLAGGPEIRRGCAARFFEGADRSVRAPFARRRKTLFVA